MPVAPIVSTENGVPFLVSAGIVYEIIAAACSSPQTTEINADTRASTLFKWVHIGLVQSVGFVAIAAYIDREHALPIIAGGGLAAVLMYGSYWHARASGLGDGKPGTETR
ncbi:MAG TPA: hypothetical protein VNV87_12250 [Acidimicrobiales bacterium]|nr:hypothetical protein [Acidimicrobiales bacterium]